MTAPGRHTYAASDAGFATVTGLMAAVDLRRGEIVAGRYRIERMLGMGGMGVVYLARDIELDIDIALKQLRPELANRPDAFERFRQELLLARQVSSPHVVRIHDLVRHGQSWLISMDYVPGQSLEQLLAAEGSLDSERAIELTRQLALGLAAAHHRGVVHRDLKPANVLLTKDGAACITDFGVARSAGSTGITGSGIIIGTPEYLSPEQARADAIDGRSDLYALGLILFEMLSGTLPFRGGTPAEMLVQRMVREPPPVTSVKPGIPTFAGQLCSRLLELKPSRRFQSADEVVHAIQKRRVPGSPVRRARRVLVAAGTTAIVALAAAIGWQWQPDASDPGTGIVHSVPRLQLAVLPFIVRSGQGQDNELAAGIEETMAQSLSSMAAAQSADPTRVARALAELGYDAESAQRQRSRVIDTLGVHRLLEGILTREGERLALALEIRERDGDAVLWRKETDFLQESLLPEAITALEEEAYRELGFAAPAKEKWIGVDDLRLIGRLRSSISSDESINSLLASTRSSRNPLTGWMLLQALEKAGRSADAATAARAWREANLDSDVPGAPRTRAYADVLLGEYDQATELLTTSVRKAPQDHPLHLLLARAQGENGDYDLAQQTLSALVAEDPRNIDAWYLLGKYAIQAGDAKRAVDDFLVRAQVLSNRLDDHRLQADVSNAMGIGYRRLGQLEPAAERLETAVRQRGALGDARAQAASLRNLSVVRSMQGRFDDAQQALDDARKLIAPLGDSIALADLANDVGVLQEERGDHLAALAAYRDALQLRQANGDPRLIGESLINVGFAYYQTGEFDNAQTYWQQAATTYGGIDDRVGVVHAMQSLGLAETARGDWKKARTSFETSLAQAEQLQMAEERTISQAGLAELDRLEGRIDDSLEGAATALADFRHRQDQRGTVEMQLLRASAYCDVGDYANAEAALEGLAIDDIGNGEQASLYAVRLAAIALERGDTGQALAQAEDAIERAQVTHSRSAELAARLIRVRLLSDTNRRDEAMRELQHVRDGFKRYASVPIRLQLMEAELTLAAGHTGATYRETRALLARLPSYGRAFQLHASIARQNRSLTELNSEAERAARSSYEALRIHTPDAQRTALAALAERSGLLPGNP